MCMHSCFWINEHQTLDRFYSTPSLSLPWSFKCITQMSESNHQASSALQHTRRPALQRQTFPFFLISVLCCGSAVLSWEDYLLSLVLPESTLCISCHSLTCGRKGQVLFHVCQRPPVSWVQREKKKSSGFNINKYIQEFHAKAELEDFPCL